MRPYDLLVRKQKLSIVKWLPILVHAVGLFCGMCNKGTNYNGNRIL